jgi:single-strand DNA-binding protein
MPRSLNRVILLGHLGGNAEIKTTGSGVSVANFSLATERRWKDQKSGEWKSETDWHRIVFWRAENVANFLTKGKAVLVEGRLQTRSYEDKSGEKRYVTEVVADNLILLGPNAQGASAEQHGPPAGATDEDVPF